MMATKYTTNLGAGEGIIEETRILLDLWQEGMDAVALNQVALQSGSFQKITARRLRNLIIEGFAPRYLNKDGVPAKRLKIFKEILTGREFNQLLFLYTCRVHKILFDFVREVYWISYSSGRDSISNEEARKFVIHANQEGKTTSPWSDNMIDRVSNYLTGTLADFSLVENGRKSVRKILPFRIESRVFIILAYEMHFAGYGDNRILSNLDWSLYGMNREDVLNEVKRLALKDWWIVQSAGDVTRVGWQYSSMEELIDAFAKG